jgi:hypothetical protein
MISVRADVGIGPYDGIINDNLPFQKHLDFLILSIYYERKRR